MGHLGTCCSIDPVGGICYDDAKDSEVKYYHEYALEFS